MPCPVCDCRVPPTHGLDGVSRRGRLWVKLKAARRGLALPKTLIKTTHVKDVGHKRTHHPRNLP